MELVNDQIIAEMVQAIVREVAPDRIYLFGSRARGGETAGSDVDILIVEHEPFGQERSRRHEISRVRRALSRFGVATDILLYSTDEVLQWQRSINHVIGRCLREGKVLYARS
jgi:predicted nucleotidyltransferase